MVADSARRSFMAGLMVAVVALVVAVPSVAANPACGATVTHNVTLTADMNCSASNTPGIVVGKQGLTIDLNGHTLTGPGSTQHYAGIDNGTGYDHLKLENGKVQGYYEDVYDLYTTGSTILNVDAVADANAYGGSTSGTRATV